MPKTPETPTVWIAGVQRGHRHARRVFDRWRDAEAWLAPQLHRHVLAASQRGDLAGAQLAASALAALPADVPRRGAWERTVAGWRYYAQAYQPAQPAAGKGG